MVSDKEIEYYRTLIEKSRTSKTKGKKTITVSVDEFKNLVDAAQRVSTIEKELREAILCKCDPPSLPDVVEPETKLSQTYPTPKRGWFLK
jgi:hypothetical protein